ncbi:hypothetical protein LOZ58_002157 [Ophidiomyces ophidiicola]|nr:hypothetical protein LOZ58_002157 [Ophidiomyces ophidiicola]
MTLDSALLTYRPTESLVLPTDRKFFPFKIPNSHHQLRHYISTADPDKIHVAVGRIIFTIHISTRKREVVTILPFEPKCLTAGLGWIVVGGSENGDCAFIKLAVSGAVLSPRTRANNIDIDIDSPLPLYIDPVTRRRASSNHEIIIHGFGGSIVNSVTVHRLPPRCDRFSYEDIAVASNNDRSVSIYSLSKKENLKTIHHTVCMNYALISPDSKVLAAVGDSNQVWFYRIMPVTSARSRDFPGEGLLYDWEWPLIKRIDFNSVSETENQCCFTIAFSPCSSLCAVGSQGGTITIFDLNRIRDGDADEQAEVAVKEKQNDGDDVICVFRSSRSYLDVGAVRCMTFSPRPWDLLVWVEDHGRVGIADIRQAFSRRQIVKLDIEEKDLEHVRTHRLDKMPDGEPSGSEDEDDSLDHLTYEPESHPTSHRRRLNRDQDLNSIREELLAQDLTARERQIIDFLNAARWASSIEEGRQRTPRHVSPLQLSGGSRASPFSTSPPENSQLADDQNSGRPRTLEPRRRSSVVLSHQNQSSPAPSGLGLMPHPTVALRWTTSPSQLAPGDSPFQAASVNAGESSASAMDEEGTIFRSPSGERLAEIAFGTRIIFDRPRRTSNNSSGHRQRSLRSRSIPRRAERDPAATEAQARQDLRSNLATERLRLQRRAAIEESQRLSQWDYQYRRHADYSRRTPPRLRTELSGATDRAEIGVGTAGVGWGADGRTLYIGTEEGIFEYKINTQDRKTFPGISCR